MKKIIDIVGMCVFALGLLAGCGGEVSKEIASGGTAPAAVTGAAASDQAVSGQAIYADEKPAYVKAYREFLHDEDIDPGHDFPIRGYYLLDLNFDEIPELGVLHHSGGSMGGYFTYYYFDGTGIKALLNDRGEPARVSDYVQVLADFEQKKVYLLKEMYLLQGNQNGTCGYVREIKSECGELRMYDVLELEVDEESDLSSHAGTQYECEDEFLSDSDLEDCLITRSYVGKKWVEISSDEYLRQKRERIPEKNSFVDLQQGAVNYSKADYGDDDDAYRTDLRMEDEEIERLFERYAQSPDLVSLQ